MTQIKTTRTPDLDKALQTAAGQQLRDLLTYLVQDFADTAIRALRKGLSFVDNVDCLVVTVSLKHDTWQEIETSGATPSQVIFGRVVSIEALIGAYGWYLDENGRLKVKVQFTTAPTSALDVTLTILF